jgi:hypothetical protein
MNDDRPLMTRRDRIAAGFVLAFSLAMLAFCVWGLLNPVDFPGWHYAKAYFGGR